MGTDLRSLDPEELRRQIALVSQETWLFNDTLKANILMANPEADETSLNEAIERASLTKFVRGLPDGLETQVGERGVRLSGGQRQKIAIARAFLKDAAVLILDEATSHLVPLMSLRCMLLWSRLWTREAPLSSHTVFRPLRTPMKSWSWTRGRWSKTWSS